MTDSTAPHRLVIVHGQAEADVLRALRNAGLRVIAANGEVAVWAPGPSPEIENVATPVPLEPGPQRSLARLLATPEEAAESLGIGRTKVYELLRSRQLASVTIGGSRRIRVADLEAFSRQPQPQAMDARSGIG